MPGTITFSSENIKIVRPGDGAPPSLYDRLIGRISKQNYAMGSPISLDTLI